MCPNIHPMAQRLHENAFQKAANWSFGTQSGYSACSGNQMLTFFLHLKLLVWHRPALMSPLSFSRFLELWKLFYFRLCNFNSFGGTKFSCQQHYQELKAFKSLYISQKWWFCSIRQLQMIYLSSNNTIIFLIGKFGYMRNSAEWATANKLRLVFILNANRNQLKLDASHSLFPQLKSKVRTKSILSGTKFL